MCDLYEDIEITGAVQSTDLVEASGLAVSRTASDVLWSHNDSRGGPTLFAIGTDGIWDLSDPSSCRISEPTISYSQRREGGLGLPSAKKSTPRHRLLVFIVAYEAEPTLRSVLDRIPRDVLVICVGKSKRRGCG